MTIRDFLKNQASAIIVCPIKNIPVRFLTVQGDEVCVDAITEEMWVPLDTELIYQPWVFDRGSILFKAQCRTLKLCTEADKVRFPDGTECLAGVS